ncbi:MAG: hypothetical protein R2788_05465 [Saprospiraceae bacterium]
MMVGYENTYQLIEVPATGNLDLGEITISEDVAQLDQVTVTAKKPLFEQKNRQTLTVNVSNSITSASVPLEVLERSPGVIVNRQQGGISIAAGKEGVVVMINGKINRMPLAAVVEFLDGMPSSNIEK